MLHLTNDRHGVQRKVLRLAINEEMKADIEGLRGEFTLSRYFSGAAEQFVEQYKWGDKSIFNLLDP